MRRLLILGLAVAALASAATGQTANPALPAAADFSPRVTNGWFPLTPGTTLVYRGSKDGKAARDVFTVSRQTTVINGVRCAVVHDRLYLDGQLHERTTDWYAQDRQGNVWYFGEATAVLDRSGRVVDTEGSFQAGRDGAQAGLFIPGKPRIGKGFRQEYYKGHAEDQFRVLSLAAPITTPFVTSTRALLTAETTPLEPGVVDHKYYVRGIGTVLEEAVKGGTERLVLVSVTHAG